MRVGRSRLSLVRAACARLLLLASCCLVLSATAALGQEHGFADWVGALAPRGVASLDAALASGRVVVLHFTGEAGPDNIAQTITLNRLRERYGNDVVFLRAENETTEGDKVFDAFGATRIPSVVIVDTAGVVTVATEVPMDEAALADAIDEARTHGPPLRSEQPSIYELDSPLPTPRRLLGRRAPASTPVLAAALQGAAPIVVAFTGEFSRYDSEQEQALAAVEEALGEGVTVARLSATDGANEPAFHDYSVTGVPTLVVVRGGAVAGVLNGLTGPDAIMDLLAGAGPEPTAPDEGAAPVAEGSSPDEGGTPAAGGGARPGASGEGAAPQTRAEARIEATEGVEGNLLSPSEGAKLTVPSAVNEEYGPNRLVDGLLSGDEGFLPWVSAAAEEPPFDIEVAFASPTEVSGLELSVATGDPVLFGGRWPTAVRVLYIVAGETEAREWASADVDADGSPIRLEIEPTPMSSLVIRILGMPGGGRPWELAEIRAW